MNGKTKRLGGKTAKQDAHYLRCVARVLRGIGERSGELSPDELDVVLRYQAKSIADVAKRVASGSTVGRA